MGAALVEEVDVQTAVSDLVKAHRALEGEPLHLAVQVTDPKHKKRVILFEVVGGFGAGRIDPQRRFLRVEMAWSAAPDGKLHLVLTSPEELKEAVLSNWRDVQWVKPLLKSARFHHRDAKGKALLELLRA